MKLSSALCCLGAIAALRVHHTIRASAQADSAGPPPKALLVAGERGEDLYDAARAGAWKTAARQLAGLEAAMHRLAPEIRTGAGQGDRFEREVTALDGTVARRERQATTAHANQVTLIVADLTEPFSGRIPAAITRLDYYGRELAIGATAGDYHRLETAARGLRHEWDIVRPLATARAPAVARRFEGLVARVEAARSRAEYGRLAAPLLDEVDELERVARPA
jgi:hypothetical protein